MTLSSTCCMNSKVITKISEVIFVSNLFSFILPFIMVRGGGSNGCYLFVQTVLAWWVSFISRWGRRGCLVCKNAAFCLLCLIFAFCFNASKLTWKLNMQCTNAYFFLFVTRACLCQNKWILVCINIGMFLFCEIILKPTSDAFEFSWKLTNVLTELNWKKCPCDFLQFFLHYVLTIFPVFMLRSSLVHTHAVQARVTCEVSCKQHWLKC